MSLSHTAGLLCPSLNGILAEGLSYFFLSRRIQTLPPNTRRLQLSPDGRRCWLARGGLVQALGLSSHQELPVPRKGTQPQHAAQPGSSHTPGREDYREHSKDASAQIPACAPGERACRGGCGHPTPPPASPSRAWLKSPRGHRLECWGPSTSLTKPSAGFKSCPYSGVC